MNVCPIEAALDVSYRSFLQSILMYVCKLAGIPLTEFNHRTEEICGCDRTKVTKGRPTFLSVLHLWYGIICFRYDFCLCVRTHATPGCTQQTQIVIFAHPCLRKRWNIKRPTSTSQLFVCEDSKIRPPLKFHTASCQVKNKINKYNIGSLEVIMFQFQTWKQDATRTACMAADRINVIAVQIGGASQIQNHNRTFLNNCVSPTE